MKFLLALANRIISARPERAGEAFMDSCERIAVQFSPFGFEFKHKAREMVRKSGHLSFHIYFQTSSRNVSNRHVALRIAIAVRSTQLQAWRKSQACASRQDDWLAGGSLTEDHVPAPTWELAEPSARTTAVANAATAIRTNAIPFFDRFQDIHTAIRTADPSSVRSRYELLPLIEAALCFVDTAQAQAVLDDFLRLRPDVQALSSDALERFKINGFPDHVVSSYAEQVAFAKLSYGLQ